MCLARISLPPSCYCRSPYCASVPYGIYSFLCVYEKAKQVKGKPQMIVARTVKGKGVSFMELNKSWHSVAPKPDELEKALEEIRTAAV